MKSYIKIFGPPLMKAIRELEKIAIHMPEVCIMDTIISYEINPNLASDLGGQKVNLGIEAHEYFLNKMGVSIPIERCYAIFSKSGESLGEHDFYFEWFKKPSMNQVEELIERIEEALSPLGVMYMITTK